MVPSVAQSSAHTSTTSCNATSNAYVAWFYSLQETAGEAVGKLTNTILLSLAEDSKTGATFLNAYTVAVGGKGEYSNYGLGDYFAYILPITKDGAASGTQTATTVATSGNMRHAAPYTVTTA